MTKKSPNASQARPLKTPTLRATQCSLAPWARSVVWCWHALFAIVCIKTLYTYMSMEKSPNAYRARPSHTPTCRLTHCSSAPWARSVVWCRHALFAVVYIQNYTYICEHGGGTEEKRTRTIKSPNDYQARPSKTTTFRVTHSSLAPWARSVV